MSEPLDISLDSNAAQIAQRLTGFPAEMQAAIAHTLDLENELTVGHIAQARATGTGPFDPSLGKLGVRSNRYRQELHNTPARVSGDVIEGAIGDSVKYAGAHEFGVNKEVTVRAFTRRNPQHDVFRTGAKSTLTLDAVGHIVRRNPKPVAQGISRVRAHRRKMNLPMRAPIRRGINDRRAVYSQSISTAIVTTWQGGQS